MQASFTQHKIKRLLYLVSNLQEAEKVDGRKAVKLMHIRLAEIKDITSFLQEKIYEAKL